MRPAIHKRTGELALVRKSGERGLCLAQFNRRDHPQSHGWHLHRRDEFCLRDWSVWPWKDWFAWYWKNAREKK